MNKISSPKGMQITRVSGTSVPQTQKLRKRVGVSEKTPQHLLTQRRVKKPAPPSIESLIQKSSMRPEEKNAFKILIDKHLAIQKNSPRTKIKTAFKRFKHHFISKLLLRMKKGSPRFLKFRSKLPILTPPLFPKKASKEDNTKLISALIKAKITNETRLSAFLDSCERFNQESTGERILFANAIADQITPETDEAELLKLIKNEPH